MKKIIGNVIVSILLILNIFQNILTVPYSYAVSDGFGNEINKYIISETSTGVVFGIDWMFSGGVNTGASISDNFGSNLTFISKNDGVLSSMTTFASGSNYLNWNFNQSTGVSISGTIEIVFSKDDYEDYTNSANLSGEIYSCIENPQSDFVTAEYEIEPTSTPPVSTDLMIYKMEGNCTPPLGTYLGTSINGHQNPGLWNCTNTSPNYNVGDYVYFTLYTHNSGAVAANNIGVADKFDRNIIKFDSMITNGMGSYSYTNPYNIIGWTNGFTLMPNRGTYAVLRYEVIADEANSGVTQNQAKTWIMDGSQYYGWLLTNYDTITFPGDMSPSNNTSSDNINIVGYDLSITKSLQSGTEGAGNTVTYRLSFTNNGRARDDIKVVDNFTFDGVTFVNRSSPLTIDNPTTLTNGDPATNMLRGGIHMSAYQSSYIDITVTLPTHITYCTVPPAYQNHAYIGTDAGQINGMTNLNDSNIINNNSYLTITPTGIITESGHCGVPNVPYDLILQSKTADKSLVTVGDKVTYTLNLYNSGIKDKRVYLQDNYTQGMIFDKIVINTGRYIKWWDNSIISNHILSTIEAPNYHFDYMQELFLVFWGVPTLTGYNIFDLVEDNPIGSGNCHIFYDTGSMYHTNYFAIMDIYDNFDEIYDGYISLGYSIPTSISLAMADIYSDLYTYKENALDTNSRNTATLYNQAYSCYYYTNYELAIEHGYTHIDAQNYSLSATPSFASSLSNIYNLVDYYPTYKGGKNKINGLINILELVGYNEIDINLSDYSSTSEAWQEVYNMFVYPDLYIDLWQGDVNARGPINNITGESNTSGTYYLYNNVQYNDFGDFISSNPTCSTTGLANNNTSIYIICNISGLMYNIPLYKPTAIDNTTIDRLNFQQGGEGNIPITFFYLPANQTTQFQYSMIVGNGYNSGDNIPNEALIASCKDGNCAPGVFNWNGETTPGSNNTATTIITYYGSPINYDLSGTHQITNISTNPPQVGSHITYQLQYCNNGPDAATGVTITYDYDNRLSYISTSGGSIGSVINYPSKNLLTWSSETNLIDGQCETIDLVFEINSLSNPTNHITNILHVGLNDPTNEDELSYVGDTDFTNNHVLEYLAITNNISTSNASKSVLESKNPYTSGSEITFIINFTGHGTDTTIIDTFDDNILIFSGATDGGYISGNQVIRENINNNVTGRVEVTFIVNGSATPGIYTNQATITSSGQPICSTYTTNISSSVSGSGTDPIHGLCGSSSGQVIYNQNNGRSGLYEDNPTLCASGAVTNFSTGTDGTGHYWSWSCEGEFGGSDVSCSANELYCGDGVTQYSEGEQCDGELGCSNQCQWIQPACPIDLTFTPSNGPVPLTVTGTWTLESNITGLSLNRGTGSPISNPISPISTIYNQTGTYNVVLTIANIGNTSITTGCIATVQVNNTPIDGVCNPSVSGNIYYSGVDIIPNQSTRCTPGVVTGISMRSTGSSWNCEGNNGGSDSGMCTLNIIYCGDGIVNGDEQCEPSQPGCTASCTYQDIQCEDFDFQADPNGGTTGQNITWSWTGLSGFDIIAFNSGVGGDQSPTSSPQTVSYNNAGLYTGYILIENSLSGTISQVCQNTVIISANPINAICGSAHNTIYYTGSAPATGDLCSPGNYIGFVSTSTGWTWSCDGINGGNPSSICTASKSYCGDGIVGTGVGYDDNDEQCDLGDDNGPNSTCSNSCTWNIPTCYDLSIDNSTGNTGDIFNISGSGSSWASGQLYLTDFGTSSVANIWSTGTAWTTTGIKQVMYTVSNPSYTSNIAQCTGEVQILDNTLPGVCGSKWNNKQVNYLSPTTKYLCDLGTVTGFSMVTNMDGSMTWTWSCNNLGSLSPQCSAYKPPNAASNFDLSINKYITGSAGPYNSGDTVTYQIDLYNSGSIIGSNVVVYDNLPNGFELITGSIEFISGDNLISYSGSTASGELWEISYFENNTGISIIYDVLITQDAIGQSGMNIASISPLDGSEETVPYTGGVCNPNNHNPIEGDYAVSGTNNTDCVEAYVEETTTYSPELIITKSGSLDIYNSGDTITYRVTISNIGTTGEYDVVMEEIFPTGFNFISSEFSITGIGSGEFGTIYDTGFEFYINYIDVGQVFVITLTGTLVGTGDQINQAIITSGSCTTCTGNWETDPEPPTPPITTIGFDLDKTVDKPAVYSGDIVIWTLTYANTGNTTCTDMKIIDYLPNNFIYGGATIDGTMTTGVAGYNPRTYTYSIGTLTPGQIGSIIITGAVRGTADTIILNTGVLYSDGNCSGIQVTDTATTTILTGWNIKIDKGVNQSSVYLGDSVIWTLNYENNSYLTAYNVIIEDILPNGVQYTSASTTPSPINGSKLTRNIGTLTPGQTGSITINTKTSSLGTHTNTVVISSPDELYTGDNQDDATIIVNCKNCGGGWAGGVHVVDSEDESEPEKPKRILEIRDYIKNIINIPPVKIIPKTGADR